MKEKGLDFWTLKTPMCLSLQVLISLGRPSPCRTVQKATPQVAPILVDFESSAFVSHMVFDSLVFLGMESHGL